MEPPPQSWRPGGYTPPLYKSTSKKPSSNKPSASKSSSNKSSSSKPSSTKPATAPPAQPAAPPPMYVMVPVFSPAMVAVAPQMYVPMYAMPQPAPAPVAAPPVKKASRAPPASTVVSGSAASTSLSSIKSAPIVKKEKITVKTHTSGNVKTSSSKKDAPSTKAPKRNPNEAPKIRSGTNYMFPPEHTQLHIFKKSSKIWQSEYNGKPHSFRILTTATHFTVKMVIDNTLANAAIDSREWACTEVTEEGEGKWRKGSTIAYTDGKANGTLKSMGWSTKRGDSLPPVWLVIHKL